MSSIANLGKLSFLAISMMIAFLPSSVSSDETGWLDKAYPYAVVSQDVQTVLREFGRNLGIPVNIEGEVACRSTESSSGRTGRDFLNNVTLQCGLDWFFDGRVLHISSEVGGTRLVPLRGVEFEQLQEQLDEFGVVAETGVLRHDGKNADVALVSGPPAFVGFVESAIDELAIPAAVVIPHKVEVVRGRAKRGALE